MIPIDDARIIELFFARDEGAIDAAKHKYGARLFVTAKNIVINREDAEECLMDALFKAWQTIPPLKPDMLGAYLTKIVRNQAINKWEAKKAAKRGGGEVEAVLDELEYCIPSAQTVEQTVEADTTTREINAFLAKLDVAARVAFVLRYFHGHSIDEICTRFGQSESKIKSMLFRTRKKLRAHLEKEGVAL
jgi:RNA polymerase sigma-70 factor (ECF subfamily)